MSYLWCGNQFCKP